MRQVLWSASPREGALMAQCDSERGLTTRFAAQDTPLYATTRRPQMPAKLSSK